MKREYDFINWTSFPSSAKIINDAARRAWEVWWLFQDFAVTPGRTLKVEVKAKQTGVSPECEARSDLVLDDVSGKKALSIALPFGTFDWGSYTTSVVVPSDVRVLRGRVSGGAGTPEKPGITWWDDLKIYQDDALIYSNDFSNWDPMIGAGVGAGILGIVVPAVLRVPEPGVAYEYQKPILEKEPLLAAGLAGLGILVGGGIGLLTGLGIIPVPQIPIPTFGAAPEGPGAPAQLGKYRITG